MAKKVFKERLKRAGAIVDDSLAQHMNSQNIKQVARGWVKGYSLLQKPVQTKIQVDEFIPVNDEKIPFD